MRILCGIILTLLIASCATGYSSLKKGPSEEELLRERVTLLWESKKRGDWESVKALVDPELKEEVSPYLDSLKSRPSANLASFSIKEIILEEGAATVISNIAWELTAFSITSKSETTDMWIKREGVWYVIMKRPDFSGFLESMGIKMKGGKFKK